MHFDYNLQQQSMVFSFLLRMTMAATLRLEQSRCMQYHQLHVVASTIFSILCQCDAVEMIEDVQESKEDHRSCNMQRNTRYGFLLLAQPCCLLFITVPAVACIHQVVGATLRATRPRPWSRNTIKTKSGKHRDILGESPGKSPILRSWQPQLQRQPIGDILGESPAILRKGDFIPSRHTRQSLFIQFNVIIFLLLIFQRFESPAQQIDAVSGTLIVSASASVCQQTAVSVCEPL